ncbi:MAG TPA: secretin N-terminal domain-containing protein [Gemmataceae bacterium]|nr:secretin N-terminal domain-containing protein [Gemmataceae bacterium]
MTIRSRMALIVVIAVGSSALAGDAGKDPGKLNAPASPKWEYKALKATEIIDLGKGDQNAGLNVLGDEGWELVAVEPSVPGGRVLKESSFYFKRPAAQAEASAPGAASDTYVRPLKYASAVDVAKILDKLLDGGGRMRIVADAQTNQILVTASLEDTKKVVKILEALDVPTGK